MASPAAQPVPEFHQSTDGPTGPVHPALTSQPGAYPVVARLPGDPAGGARTSTIPHPGYGSATTTDSRGRTAVVIAGLAATVAVFAALVVVVITLANGTDSPSGPGPSAGPTIAGDPPTGLKLRDEGSSITVTWTDPTAGTVPFVVAGGRAGQTLSAMASVDPATTSHTVHGLNSRVDYCFTVLAVYSTETYATSGQVCTSRGAAPTSD